MDEVELGFGAMCGDRVFGGCVNVPACEVDCLVVVGEARVVCKVVFFVGNRKGRPEAPVVEVAFEGAIVVEGGFVRNRGAVLETKTYGDLMTAGVT